MGQLADSSASSAEGLTALSTADTLAIGGEGDVESPGDFVWPPLKGTDLGGCVLLEQVGRGGMGIVYKARQKQLDRLAAVKVILAGHSATQRDMELFLAEARTAAKLRHPNVVGVYEAGQRFGWHFIAMEFIEGSSLAERVADGPLGVDEAVDMMARVARAVAYLHSEGIAHCDLKPANILIDAEGNPYVTDFGLARILEGQPPVLPEGAIAGSPSYMSPEQASGQVRQTGFASDVYSLGAILYHVLTGRTTFHADSMVSLMFQILQRDPVPPRKIRREIPVGLEAICLKCLEKRPASRYASASAFAGDLESFLSGEPLEAQRPGPWQRFVRWGLREPALSGRLIAMAVLWGVEVVLYYAFGLTDARFHRAVTGLLPLWGFVCYLLQRMALSPERRRAARLMWAVADTAFLTALLAASRTLVCSPAVACYPLLVSVSGLWHHTALVWLCTAMAMGSYGLLWIQAHVHRPDVAGTLDRHLVFLTCLAVLGFVVARLVHRIQILSRRLRHGGTAPRAD